MSRLFTSLWPQRKEKHILRDCVYRLTCLSSPHLSSLSPDADMSAWIWGLAFQSSLLGGGRSLTPDASAVFDRLLALRNNNNPLQLLHSQQNIPSILPGFHHVFRALNHHDSLERRMLAHDSARSVLSDHELEGEEGPPLQPGCQQRFWKGGGGSLPAWTCRTNGSPRSSGALHRAASAGPCWCPWAPGRWAHPDTPQTGISPEEPGNPC